jgi:trehalose synthase
MLALIKTPTQKLNRYKNLISKELFKEIEKISRPLKGLKVFHVNSTPRGGGVAEILKTLIPLTKGVGLEAEWFTIPPQNNFFKITKKIHNALQGKEYKISFSDKHGYLSYTEKIAKLMNNMRPDIWVIHDPQPAGVINFLSNFHPSVLRIHIDLTSSNQETWKFMLNFFKKYDKIVLSSEEFVKKEIKNKTVIFQPAIDPLLFKNQPLSLKTAKGILKKIGISSNKPLISQVSRFDCWKDPLGVIKIYQLAKRRIPNLQLALVGFFLAKDDPEAEEVYRKTKKAARGDPDIFLLINKIKQLGRLKVDVFVNAVQVASTVILQNSTREGFGMVVAEAMWKARPVIGRKVGGIKLQIKDKKNGFLIDDYEEAAQKIIQLVKNKDLAKKIGREAKKTIKKNFLTPRLLKDYLKLYKKLI